MGIFTSSSLCAYQPNVYLLIRTPVILDWSPPKGRGVRWKSEIPSRRHSVTPFSRVKKTEDFPGGPVAKNLPLSSGDLGSVPGWGTKILHASGQLSPHAAATEPSCSAALEPQLGKVMCHSKGPAQQKRERKKSPSPPSPKIFL